jgi:hypothetical protein
MGGTHKGVTCWARDNLIKSILRVMEQKLFQSSINSSREVRKALEGTVDEPCRLTKVLVIILVPCGKELKHEAACHTPSILTRTKAIIVLLTGY